MVLLRYFLIKISLFRWLPYPLKHMEQRINISQPVSLFSLFQEPSTITKAIKEIFKVNAKEDVKDMDICYSTQDTMLTTLLEVHSYTPPSSKEKQLPNEESNSKAIAPKSTNLTPKTSKNSTTTSSTATLKSKAPLKITKSPK